PGDRVPTDPVAIAVALADKLDILVGFWAIDEKPTGSKDPYALRRAALGVVRIILNNGLSLPLGGIITQHVVVAAVASAVRRNPETLAEFRDITDPELLADAFHVAGDEELTFDLLGFFADRLKVQLREQGARHDLVDAVFALGNQDDLLLIVRRVEALGAFLDSESG